MITRVVVALALGLLISGAQLQAQPTPRTFQSLVRDATPPEDGNILFSSPAEWLHDQYGLAASNDNRQGVFVLTETSLLFLQWLPMEEKYKTVYRAPYAAIDSHQHLKRGRSRTIAISANDRRSQTFNMIGDSGVLVDQEASERARTIMNQKIPVPPIAPKG